MQNMITESINHYDGLVEAKLTGRDVTIEEKIEGISRGINKKVN